jgi:hypothetical protein
MTKTGRRQAMALSARMIRKDGSGVGEGARVTGCFESKTNMPPYSSMKRRMLTFMSRPTHMATVMVDEPP